jgi:hypothetical protein
MANTTRIALIGSATALALVSLVAIYSSREKTRPQQESTASVQDTAPRATVAGAAPDLIAPSQPSLPEAVESPSAHSTESISAKHLSRPELLAQLRAQLDVMEEEGVLGDGEALAALLEQTALMDWYEAATPVQRMALIDMLMENGIVRDHVAALLPFEEDSQVRSFLLDRTDPRGLFDETESPEGPPTDQELADLLWDNRPENMDQPEWLSRMDLGGLIHDREGARWAQEALRQRPEDFAVAILAHILILGAEQSGNLPEAIAPGASREFLTQAIMGDQFLALHVSERSRTYMAIFGTMDAPTARLFLEEARHRETEESAQRLIDALLKTL